MVAFNDNPNAIYSFKNKQKESKFGYLETMILSFTKESRFQSKEEMIWIYQC